MTEEHQDTKMEAYRELLRWAETQGVEMHGVEPRRIPGRGIGIVATKALQADERLIWVPTSVLRTLDTVPKRIAKRLPKDMRVHGLLAADLALDRSKKYEQWNAIVPSREDVWASLPLTWDPELHEFLPRPARDILRRQTANFDKDWAAMQPAYPTSVPKAEYLYAWALVNTRTFYFETPKTKKLHKDDRMVLQPVADLFNHADEGCEVCFDQTSFTVTARRAYSPGEEVFISYGNHSNDFLLVEYGFVMAQNRWDEVCLDDAILPELSARQKVLLEESGFLGNYMLDDSTVCYRTQAAVRILCVPVRDWRRFVEEGVDGGEAQQDKVDRLLIKILQKYVKTITKTLQSLKGLKVGQACQLEMLSLRWQQIQALTAKTITGLDA